MNVKTRQLTFARAGHPYPILVRPGEPPEQLQVRGSLLGVFENAEYLQQTMQLHSGDKLILYSDGAEPFIGRSDDQRGFIFADGFRETLDEPITDMVDRLSQLARHQPTHPAEVDDITIVGLEIC